MVSCGVGIAQSLVFDHSVEMDAKVPHLIERRAVEALEAVYRAFEAPPPSVIEGCPCCIDTRNTDLLLSTPLRQIPGMVMWRYVSGAFLTVGGERDFRYLLPRILDVGMFDPGNLPDPQIILGKLPLANWRSWQVDEQRVIEALVAVWFEYAVSRDLASWDGWSFAQSTEGVLCGAARAGLPLSRYLSRLSEPDAEPILGDLRESFPEKPSYFWEDVPEAFYVVRAFLEQGRP